MTCGNFAISFSDDKEKVSCFTVGLFFDRISDDTKDAISTYAAISKITLYVISKLSNRIEPISGPIINPVVKNPVNVAMFRTRVFPLLTLEIIASQGGQKNAWATPVMTLNPIISGTLCAIESRYTDAELILSLIHI